MTTLARVKATPLGLCQPQDHKRGKAAYRARRKRYEQIDDMKAVIRIYEDRIDELRTEMRRLYKLNHG